METPCCCKRVPSTLPAFTWRTKSKSAARPGTKPGAAISAPFAVNMMPMPLPADRTFVWVLKAGDREWRASFATRPLQQSPHG